MANHYVNAVKAHGALPATVKYIAWALADRANDTGTCWPSLKTLSSDTGYSVSTVKRSISTLKASGYLTIASRRRKDGSQTSNRYHLILDTFASGVKHVTKVIKQGVTKAVKMGQPFVKEKIQTIKPTSSRIGQQAWLELKEADRETVINRLTRKNNPTLQQQLTRYGLDSAYVQKALFNDVQQFKRKRSTRPHQSTIEKLTDRSWDTGVDAIWEASPCN